MAHNNNANKSNAADAAIPLMAAAMIQQGGGDNDAIRQIVLDLAKEQLAEREKKRKAKEKLELSAIEAVREQALQKKQKEDNCSHQRQDGKTRLAGQRLSNGQICLVCQFCHKEFHHPPQADQVDIPIHLRPNSDAIGG